MADLRRIGPVLERFEGSVLAYARGMIFWHQRHRFCGVCGTATRIMKGGHQRICTNESCNTPAFPRTDPAVIMLVYDPAEDQPCSGARLFGRKGAIPPSPASLSRGNRWKRPSPARFMKRLAWKSVTYAITPPSFWPFPASIMLGFHAEAKTTEIFRRDDELEDAQWFSRDDVMNFQALGKDLPTRIPSPDA